MGKFDSIKQDLRGDTATVNPNSTSLTDRLLESKARIRDEKVARAREVFGNGNGNGHKNTAAVAEQKAHIKSPDNTVNLPSSTVSEEDMLKPFHELGEQRAPDPIATELFDSQLEEDLAPEKLFIDMDAAAERHGLNKDLFRSLIHAESANKQDAVSRTNVKGIAQVTKRTGDWMFEGTGVKFDVNNRDHQLEAGAKLLSTETLPENDASPTAVTIPLKNPSVALNPPPTVVTPTTRPVVSLIT